jgi:hypothetical protein
VTEETATAETEWWKFVQDLMTLHEVSTYSEFCRSIGVHSAVITGWRDKGSAPNPDTARRIAHVYKRPVIEVFAKAGFATPEELGMQPDPFAPGALTNRQLLMLLEQRMIPDGAEPLNPPAQEWQDARRAPKATPIGRRTSTAT